MQRAEETFTCSPRAQLQSTLQSHILYTILSSLKIAVSGSQIQRRMCVPISVFFLTALSLVYRPVHLSHKCSIYPTHCIIWTRREICLMSSRSIQDALVCSLMDCQRICSKQAPVALHSHNRQLCARQQYSQHCTQLILKKDSGLAILLSEPLSKVQEYCLSKCFDFAVPVVNLLIGNGR